MPLKDQGKYAHVTPGDSILTLVNHPAFKGFGRYLLPRESDLAGGEMRLNSVHSLLPYHSHVSSDTKKCTNLRHQKCTTLPS